MQAPPYSPLAPATARLPLAQQAGIFGASLAAFVLLDALWIGVIASDFYNSRLSPILKAPADPAAALLCWCCIVALNQVFVLPQTLGASPFACLGQGALLGLLLYGTVDLTNCALLQGWTWLLSVVDIAWGSLACATTALLQNRLHSWLASPRA